MSVQKKIGFTDDYISLADESPLRDASQDLWRYDWAEETFVAPEPDRLPLGWAAAIIMTISIAAWLAIFAVARYLFCLI